MRGSAAAACGCAGSCWWHVMLQQLVTPHNTSRRDSHGAWSFACPSAERWHVMLQQLNTPPSISWASRCHITAFKRMLIGSTICCGAAADTFFPPDCGWPGRLPPLPHHCLKIQAYTMLIPRTPLCCCCCCRCRCRCRRYFFRQIVEGLGYCHRCHIAHRDLKLANFLLSTDEPMR